MDLKEFVSETIVSIVSGIKEAQEKTKDLGASVNPGGLMRKSEAVSDNTTWDNRNNNFSQPVAFDIAITAEDSAKGGAKVKVLSGILGGDVGGEKGSKNVLASRIQFTVPVLFPSEDIEDPAARTINKATVKMPSPIKPMK
ncbi:hypothetical protein [uncultured Microbulbifer sp.]|uniref:hypothetical protein n=1 Tax=uncultured Microbulbifer sp. TaxID=348147 RepID=UPI0026214D9F|nr:hypothetical protein [uncultured Microbulbifer sp.]